MAEKTCRTIIIFWDGDKTADAIKYRWWHLDRRFTHVTVALYVNDDHLIYFSSNEIGGIECRIGPIDWVKFAKRMSYLKEFGATEIYAIESRLGHKRLGGLGWYWCHSFVRDIAHLPFGFLLNPWHLRHKLIHYKGDDFTILARHILWEANHPTTPPTKPRNDG